MRKFLHFNGVRWLNLWLMLKHSYKLNFQSDKKIQPPDNSSAAEGALMAFMHHTSHELKGPISRLKGLFHLSQIDNSYIKEYKSRIESEISQMEGMLSKLEKVNEIMVSDYQVEECRLEDLLNEVLHQLQTQIIEQNIFVRIRADEQVIFRSIPYLLKEVLYNLLENAIQHSNSNGQAYIKISARKVKRQIHLSIEDNGSGIPEKSLSRIFGLFYRASSKSRGSGLGLFIVKEALLKLEGRISVESTEGCYSRFHIILPCEISTDQFVNVQKEKAAELVRRRNDQRV
ncbi:MAG: sensor histidine kinase [Cyclobacteriaceae bacterium]